MSPRQIQQLAKVMVNDPEIMAILRGGGKNVEHGVQDAVSKGIQSHSETEKVMVGGDPK
ncbi:hypothetical protein [Mesoaciditoga lauensis]|uniref:hypothetical protein n=1 Tax=Mesoaciditoga lauensis TaxID=1495039 RepID=UPI0012E0844C|nr:hypothetical protein [Mesoaciditoga lauensis]